MIRKSSMLFARTARPRMFSTRHDKESLYNVYQKPLALKVLQSTAKVTACVCGVTLCVSPVFLYGVILIDTYRKKFVTDADMDPYRVAPPKAETHPIAQFKAISTWMEINDYCLTTAVKYVEMKYHERKGGVSWKTKALLIKEAHLQSRAYFAATFSALKKAFVTSEFVDAANFFIVLSTFFYSFYYKREKAEIDEDYTNSSEVKKERQEKNNTDK